MEAIKIKNETGLELTVTIDALYLLVDFLLHLNDKGLIDNYDFDYEKEAKKYLKHLKQTNDKRKRQPLVMRSFTVCPSCGSDKVYFESWWTCRECTHDWGGK